jgi:two-component system, OmpR family, sensor kinase
LGTSSLIALRISTGEQLRQIDNSLSETVSGASDLLATLTNDQRIALRELPSSITLQQLDQLGRPTQNLIFGGPQQQAKTIDLSNFASGRLLASTGKPFSAKDQDGNPVRALTARYGNGFFVATAPLGTVRDSEDRLATQLTLVGLGVGGAAGLFIWGGVGTILAPLRSMIRNARRIGAGERNIPLDLKHGASEVRELGMSLDEMRRSLDENSQRLQRFTADASHDLRTPIAIIRGHTQLALQGISSPTAWDEVDRESKRMQQLIDDLWLLARLDQLDEPAHGLVDLTDVAEAATSGARLIDGTRSYEWIRPSAPALVVGDERQLRRAIDNLLSNVRSHTPEKVAVTVRVRLTPKLVECTVEDSGPGMTESDRRQATQRFWQGDVSRRTPGAGLGLAIVDRVVISHHGSIALAPSPSGGLLVTISLPRAVSRVSE